MLINHFLVYILLPRSHNPVLHKPGKLDPQGYPGSNPGRGVLASKNQKKNRLTPQKRVRLEHI